MSEALARAKATGDSQLELPRAIGRICSLQLLRGMRLLRCFAMEREAVLKLAELLGKQEDVVLKSTSDTAAIERLLAPMVRRVVIATPVQVRATAWAEVKFVK
ncbi:hypothetical protein [Variovorax sp. JS1663]|uniref:hypothetical protein n=1 Tax=Variovorax sp. JS1663 TaxID=1851577 RepID=UPI00117EEEA6|nr:hypothetical protein [Variovorax sp. JS1663]